MKKAAAADRHPPASTRDVDDDNDKIEYNNVTEINLTVAGSTWFKIDSEAIYGVGRAYPGGQYQSAVIAECIAL